MKKKLPADAEEVLVIRGRGNDELAPSEKLLHDFNELKKQFVPGCGYESEIHYAWDKSDYEKRFREQIKGDSKARARLKELAERALNRDVFLICYEGDDKPCHRRLLLQIAHDEFGAIVDPSPYRPTGALLEREEGEPRLL